MKLPRDLSGDQLTKLLRRFGYEVTRQTGSHMRVTSKWKGSEHSVTIPAHKELDLGHLQKYCRMSRTTWKWTEMNWRRNFLSFRAALLGSRRCVFSLAATLLFFSFAETVFSQQPTIRFVRNPDAAPAFKVDTLDGKPLSLADYKSKVILLNFWATWCGPCRAEVPDLVELQNKYKDQLQVIGLVVDDDDEDAIKKFAEKFGINYPIAMATDEMRTEYGGIPALPTSFVLDAEGRVVQKHEGLRDPVLYEVEIRSLLGLPIGNVKVETFEDTGQIFLKHADRATQLPGVDLSKLTPEQKTVALHKFNAESCSCGCQYTLAQCRIWDRNCDVSKQATTKIIEALAGKSRGTADASAPAKPASSDPPVPPKSSSPATPAASKKPSPLEKPRR